MNNICGVHSCVFFLRILTVNIFIFHENMQRMLKCFYCPEQRLQAFLSGFMFNLYQSEGRPSKASLFVEHLSTTRRHKVFYMQQRLHSMNKYFHI